jgi:3'-phosphoadenosine 5'-phosphosulfate sulfotransferase (PAPS reductase)/FAD synthetase
MTDRPKYKLRDCPMCHARHGEDSGPQLTKVVVLDPATGAELCDGNYGVGCWHCGVTVDAEYADEAVRLWNGETAADDDEVRHD